MQVGANDEEIELLGELITHFEPSEATTLSDTFAETALDNVLSSLGEYFEERDVFRYGYDLDSSQEQLENLVTEKFATWHITPTAEMFDEIVDAYDLKDRMQDFLASNDSGYSPSRASSKLDIESIDDLFQRDS
ncbi:hypothetical protein SAMN05216496_2023 [Pseudomonas sp. Z003-0.4C(8344-21)]|nr:hypothetical protein SAMN05216496_2023 [Pseudomonas sp. Z003-0.4C(8344-21)]